MFEIRRGEDDTIVLTGRLDATQAPRLERFLEALAGPAVLDLGGLEYISSMGLGALVKTEKRLRAGGGKGLRLVNAGRHIRDVFHFSGLDRIFEMDALPGA